MTSNYPPGVTGREWQIAGPDREETMTLDCGVDEATLLILPKEWYEQLSLEMTWTVQEFADRVKARGQVRSLLESLVEIEDVACPFEGEVEVSFYGGIGSWTCPLCGTDHEVNDEEAP
jgi:hypothetical protein